MQDAHPTFALIHGLPMSLRRDAANLIWGTFGPSIRRRVSDRAGVALVRRTLVRDRIIAAVDASGRLVGLTGLRGVEGGLIDLPSRGVWRSFWTRRTTDMVLDSLVVTAGMRGGGVGRALIDAALTVAAARGYPGLRAEVARKNHAAIGLYRSAGFVPVSRGLRVVVLRRSVGA
ncbi:MAG: hypothetical protein DI498_12900 [Paracoccus denitrificans]|nr:MAG: hypothetical protein DI498_12900 [Paracoccus denitrificans]PZO83149.1 MAG: hypothetical protein DI633_12900 [Paracoccus denitrificans]